MAIFTSTFAKFEINALNFSTRYATWGDSISVTMTVKYKSGSTIAEPYLSLSFAYTDTDGNQKFADLTGYVPLNRQWKAGYSITQTLTGTLEKPSTMQDPDTRICAPVDGTGLVFSISYFDTTTYTQNVVDDFVNLYGDDYKYFGILDKHYSPSVLDFYTERTADEALTVRSTIKVSIADDLTDTQKARISWVLKDDVGNVIPTTATLDELIAGIKDSTAFITDEFGKETHKDIILTFGDAYEYVVAYSDIDRCFANVHLSGKETGGACFGGFCKSSAGYPMLESYYPIYAYGGFGYMGQYSTEETATGMLWIDGSMIYRKALEFTSFTKGGWVNKNISASGTIDTVTAVYGMAKGASSQYPIPYPAADAYMICVNASGGDPVTQVGLYVGASLTLTHAWVIVEYTLESLDTETLASIDDMTLKQVDARTLK